MNRFRALCIGLVATLLLAATFAAYFGPGTAFDLVQWWGTCLPR